MATKLSDIPNINQQIDEQKRQAGIIQDNLNSSPTALGGEGEPTATDISNQESLQRIKSTIQRLTDQKLRTQWYGTDEVKNEDAQGEKSMGIVGNTLDFISRPLYGMVGATKHIIGQGKGTLLEDVADNMVRNKNTFGDVLKSSGVPWAVSAPLGFALDIGLDPVNWLTAGSSAMVPRLLSGAYKGLETGEGLARGLSIAAKSGLMEKASTVGKYTPFLRKSGAFSRFGENTLKATEAFETLTGKTAFNIVNEGGIVGLRNFGYHGGLMDIVNKGAEAIPGAKSLLQNFVYDPIEWVRQARMKDIFQQALGTGIDARGAVNAAVKGESIAPFMASAIKKAEAAIESEPVSKMGEVFSINMDPVISAVADRDVDKAAAAISSIGMEGKIAKAAPEIVGRVDDAASILKNPTPFVSSDPIENALRIANERLSGGEGGITLDDVSKVFNSGAIDQTGVRWFDNMMKGIKDFTIKIDRNGDKVLNVGKATMDKYDQAMGIFRVAKVGASPTSWVNAVVGNLIMNHMATGSISPRFIKRLNQVFGLYRNKPGKAALLDSLLMDAGDGSDFIRRGIWENETAARGTFGDIGFIGNVAKGKLGASHYTTERILRNGIDAGVISSATKAEDIAPEVQEAVADILKFRDEEIAKVYSDVKAGTTPVRKLMSSGKLSDVSRSDIGTGMLANEMFSHGATAKMFEHIAQKAKENPSNVAWRLLDFTFNKMSSGYETIDQTYKMASFLNSTIDGYTLKELRSLRNFIDINPEELIKYSKDGEFLYRLSPATALELSNVMFLNYNAMPAAIRVMRNFPLLGSPFVSFMYGMALKTGQTLAYNPAAFNKITFAMNDFGGTKNPLEKKALDTKFYSYLNQPAMFRTPFFEKNPIYINLASMIPYYSMNMFNPSQSTNESNTVREKLVRMAQQSPLMKDPAGSALFDFVIQPLILGEAIQPQGQFGQPLYPADAGIFTKTGYGARTVAEAFVPSIASYAGLVTPEKVADFIPSYRWRQLSRAKAGKNQIGISSKESAASRTTRTLLQASGIPVQAPVNTSFNQGNSNQ